MITFNFPEMKNYKYKFLAWAIALALFVACQPMEEDKPEAGQVTPPDAGSLDFTVSPQADGFRYALQFTQPQITGIYQVSWSMGNGSVATGEKATAYYPLPGTYTVKMTIKTNMGSTTKEKSITTTKTDYSIFNDPITIFLSGGVDALNGKTWAADSMARGHMSVGQAGTDGTGWWVASPLEKKDAKVMYDDLITFKLDGFKVIYVNHGQSFVKGPRRTDPAYSNPVNTTGDWAVDYPNPQPGSWSLEKRGNKTILKLSGPTPIFPIYDSGAKDGEYEIVSIDENFLDLLCTDIEGNAWRTKLIRAGYVKPMVTLDAALRQEAAVNTYKVTISNVVIPDGESITGLKADFGDGTIVESADYNLPTTHTYMRKGNYTVTLTVLASSGNIVKTFPAPVAANHPDYVPFLLDQMVMYQDFSEVALAPMLVQDGSLSVVANPDKTYPNKSSFVAMTSKSNNQYSNAYMKLPAGYRFDIRTQSKFRVMVYGKAGEVVLMKLENTDKAEPWQTGTEKSYTIKKDYTWEVAEFDFAGVPAGFDWGWWPNPFRPDVTKDDEFNHDFYDVVRLFINSGVGEGSFTLWFDELAGPHVEGLKSAKR